MNKRKLFLAYFFIPTLVLTLIVGNVKLGSTSESSSPISLQGININAKSNQLPASRLDPKVFSQLLEKKDINGAVRHVELGWKQQYEEYIQGKLPSNQVVEVEQIQRILRQVDVMSRLRLGKSGRKTALLYAVPTPNHLELILVTPGKNPIHRRITSAKRAELIQVINKFRQSITNKYSEPQEYQKTGKQLYDWLLAPVESQLESAKINNIIFCLGGGLRSLPLAAISDGQKFLIEKYSLGIIPAFNLLDYQPDKIHQTQILAMGASEFTNQSALPAVPVELSSITSRPWQGKSLLNEEFTLENFKKQREIYPFGIVHLATHAEFSPGSIDNSYIQFWDRQIKLNEIKKLELAQPTVQLLVLSACQTALGDPKAELGFAGLAVQSGAKAAIASLWSVDDGGTLALMTQFYRQLNSTPIKAEALRQTQIAMIQRQLSLKTNPVNRGEPLPPEISPLDSLALSHPFYWAGFTVIGNPW